MARSTNAGVVDVASVSQPGSYYDVSFDEEMSSALYVPWVRTYKSDSDLTSCGGDILMTSRTINGFRVLSISEVPCKLAYSAFLGADAAAVSPTTNRLSRDWTAWRFWLEAAANVKFKDIALMDIDKLRIINNNIAAVQSKFFGLIGHRYLTQEEVTVASNRVDLRPYRIASGGGEAKLRLISSDTTATIRGPVSPAEVEAFRNNNTSAVGKAKTILWAIHGDTLELGKGSGLSSYGATVTLEFPRIATEVTDPSQKIDLVDGGIMRVALLRAQAEIRQKFMNSKDDMAEEIKGAENEVYRSFGIQAQLEEQPEKLAGAL